MKSSLFRTMSAVAALGAVLSATACGAPEKPGGVAGDTSNSGVVQENATPPAKGNIDAVNWIVGKEPRTTDLDNNASNSNTDIIMSNVCEKLVQVNTDLEIQPNIATDWEWTDENHLVFNLRDDVTFHNGDKMTADDVVWSMKRHMADDAAEADKFAVVTDVTKTGDNQVTFETTQRDAALIVSMAGGAGLVVSQKMIDEQGDQYGKAGGTDACSGPYELAEWASGSKIVLKKAENYWNPDRAAHVGEVTLTWGSDDTMINSLLTGSASGAYLENLGSATRLLQDDNLNVYQGDDTRVWSLMATERGGLTDPRLRQALSLVIDRQGINQAAFSGFGQAWSEPVGSLAWTSNRDEFEAANKEFAQTSPLEVTDENIEKAKKLVEEVGATQEIVVATDGEPIRSALAEAVVSAADQVGLKAKIVRYSVAEYGKFYSDPDARKNVDLFSDDYFISTMDPIGFYKNGASTSNVQYVMKDPAYDELIKKARASKDADEHAKYSIELAQKWQEGMPWISTTASPSMVAFTKDVTGIPASGNFRYYPWLADLGSAE